MKRKLWTLLLALGAALALCVGAGAAEVSVTQANQLIGDSVELNGEYKRILPLTGLSSLRKKNLSPSTSTAMCCNTKMIAPKAA